MSHLACLLSLALLLAACGGTASPQLIGSYPRGVSPTPPPLDFPPPDNRVAVYNLALTLAVKNVRLALAQTEAIAYNLDGSVLWSRTWREADEDHAELTIAVPYYASTEALTRLKELGHVVSQTDLGVLRFEDSPPNNVGGQYTYTVTLQPPWWAALARWAEKAFWVSLILIPPTLMLIGLFTVLRGVGRWLRARLFPPTP